MNELLLPAGDIVSAHGVLAQHVSIAHVPCDLHGDPFQVNVLPSSVSEVHAAHGSPPASQLSSKVPRVQVSSSALAAGHTPAVAIPYRGGVARLQTGARLAQAPRRQRGPGGSEAEDTSTASAVVAAAAAVAPAANVGGDAAVEGGFQGAEQVKKEWVKKSGAQCGSDKILFKENLWKSHLWIPS